MVETRLSACRSFFEPLTSGLWIRVDPKRCAASEQDAQCGAGIFSCSSDFSCNRSRRPAAGLPPSFAGARSGRETINAALRSTPRGAAIARRATVNTFAGIDRRPTGKPASAHEDVDKTTPLRRQRPASCTFGDTVSGAAATVPRCFEAIADVPNSPADALSGTFGTDKQHRLGHTKASKTKCLPDHG